MLKVILTGNWKLRLFLLPFLVAQWEKAKTPKWRRCHWLFYCRTARYFIENWKLRADENASCAIVGSRLYNWCNDSDVSEESLHQEVETRYFVGQWLITATSNWEWKTWLMPAVAIPVENGANNFFFCLNQKLIVEVMSARHDYN